MSIVNLYSLILCIQFEFILIFSTIGSNYMVILKDPASIENVLRTEGRYPVRDTMFSANTAWLIKHRAKAPVIFSLE